MSRHRTIAKPVVYSGSGLHTGEPARLTLLPSETPGIRLLTGDQETPCRLEAVSHTARCVAVGSVLTVEHLLAAAWTLGITALRVLVEGPEIPAGDGSALPFVELLREAGARELEEEVPELRLAAPVWVQQGGALAAAFPDAHLRVTYVVPLRGREACAYDLVVTPERFVSEIAPARTWGYREEAEALWGKGLARGSSLDNTLVLEEGRFLNPPRFPDEPARHKILDLLGDLALLGERLVAHVVCVGGGHGLHLRLARAIPRRSS
ncbi:MAG: UDP-3-O-acyl-N-acetylglucosamine deacetylase [Armatimonadetes bacterium]|nr:UDP-3-O-acyl-N-acetylglucosamine deacetylase [Armatimonadota bacterium]MDW8154524.1 UDP-3-O-acyl-N-acetylglucosamine deacetylase [Armatimonadota bacterium]